MDGPVQQILAMTRYHMALFRWNRRRLAFLAAGLLLLSGTVLVGQTTPQSALAEPRVGTGMGGVSFQTGLSTRQFLNSPSYYGGAPGGRGSMAGWRAFAGSLKSDERTANTQLGPVSVTFSTGLRAGYDSNINNSGSDPLWDFIIEPNISMSLNWPITRYNELDFTIGLSYQYYVFHPEYASSGFTLDPGTELSFRIFTGDFVITLYDSPTITTNPPDTDPTLTNTGFIRELSNRVGISILWDWNKLVSTAGIERLDSLSLSGNFDSLNQTSYLAFFQSFYEYTPTTSIGIRTSGSVNVYQSSSQNNSLTGLVGAILTTRLTEYTSLYLELGLQTGIFEDSAPQSSTPVFETDSDGFNSNVETSLGGANYVQPYFRFALTNQLNRYLSQDFSASRDVSNSAVSNYREEYTFTYALNWRMNRLATLTAEGFTSFGRVSSAENPYPYYQYGARLNFSFNIMRDVSLSLSYEYLLSNFEDSEDSFYTRQRIFLTTTWSF